MQQLGNKTEFACLYTKHKNQKRKVWNDGRLVVLQSNALLHDANPVPGSSDPVLDQCELSKDQMQVLLTNREMMLEGEKFLIEVEGEWRPPSMFTSKPKFAARKMSYSIKKKFKIPPPFIPSSSNSQEGTSSFQRKRKRLLQPGELARMHRREATTSNYNVQPADAHLRQSQQLKSTRNHYECENPNRSVAKTKYSSRLPPGHDVFSHASPEENERAQRDKYAANHRNSLEGNITSIPQKQRPTATSGLPEYEAEANVSDHLSARVVNDGTNTMDQTIGKSSDMTFVSNDFDEGNFYGLDEEETDVGNNISTERIDGATRNNLATNYNLSAPNTFPVSNRNDTVSDDTLLAMFGAAPTDQDAREPR
ncbi:unnamed protein product [Cylindrotheca closterium]|uniref:5'-3' DNA helicase ZGRF1-like N-terminal domain-containing protein n=1 Tax=Cylindrotheca closterium TaxID=2856 RepID=A0AAD2FKC8_9STRA|nr:unnamed protein product [Cylindrotheca closterium]